MVDPEYGGPTWPRVGIELPAGCHPYDGVHALAYARICKGWIELADLIFELPGILAAVGATVQTGFPRSLAGDLASLLPLVTGPEIDRVVLSYPQFVDLPTHPLVNWYLGTSAEGPPQAAS